MDIKSPFGLLVMYDFNQDGLLTEWQDNKMVFVWTYSMFEEYAGEAISPSMYEYMANYVLNSLESDRYALDLESNAVDSYYSLSDTEKEKLSEQMLANLMTQKYIADSKASAAINTLLDEDTWPFDDSSPISHECVVFLRGLVQKYTIEAQKLTDKIHEEELKH